MTQRVIKFRAWDLDKKEFFEETWLMDFIEQFKGQLILENDRLVFQQFTGLHDKNGKEIYEGDLLKISMGGDEQDEPYKVENMWDLRIAMEDKDNYMRIGSDFEVIGNIYENPELVKIK